MTSYSQILILISILNPIVLVLCQDDQGIYKIGTGIADITGPAAGVVLNGYVNPITLGAGVHTRLHARSVVVESITSGNRNVFVTCDLGILDHGIKLEVVKKLKAKFGNDKYTEKNVMISASHTHSGPSGYMQYYTYLVIESYGFNPLSFWAIVDGIVESIIQADETLVPGKIFKNKGELLGYNGNRGEAQYEANPETEKAMYDYNVDKNMTMLRFDAVNAENEITEPLGVFTWWPAHPIAFNGGLNPLVSSDIKGYASVMFDYAMNQGVSARPGRGKFVAGFASSNLGDVTPRYGGALKGEDDLEKVGIVGTAQFEKAYELYSSKDGLVQVKGPIQFIQQYVDMTNVQVRVNNSEGQPEIKKTCKAALGYSFVGLGPSNKPLWDLLLSSFNITPSAELVECQKPKEVALPAGEMHQPWEWAPSIVDLQVFRIGNVDIVSAPGELTTMAGRRLRRAIQALVPLDHEVIIAGLVNNYINYIVTPEEYGLQPLQDSEAGATIFGQYTLTAIIQTQEALMTALNNNAEVDQGPIPPNYTDMLREEIPDRVDRLPANRNWGDVVEQPEAPVSAGTELRVVFITPSLRHNPLRGQSHFLIEKLVDADSDSWEIIRTDADLDTTFAWNALLNRGVVKWWIPVDPSLEGTYRITQTGYYLESEGADLKSYSGSTQLFQILVEDLTSESTPQTTADSNDTSSTENYETTPNSAATHNLSIYRMIPVSFVLLCRKLILS